MASPHDSDSDDAYEDASENVTSANEASTSIEDKMERLAKEIEENGDDYFASGNSSHERGKAAVFTTRPEGIDDAALHDNVMKGIHLFLSNRFHEAQSVFAIYAKCDPLHSLCYGSMSFLKALMTFAEQDFEEAAEQLQYTQELATSLLEKPSMLTSIGRFFGAVSKPKATPSYLDNTLVLAESYLLRSMLLLFQESIISYVKAGLGLRRGWNNYEECFRTISEVEKDKSFALSPDTWSGIQFGFGNFNMVISMLPAKILRIVSALGYPGDRVVGLSELNKALSNNGARSPLAGLSLLFYHIIYPSFFCPPNVDFHITEAERILKQELSKYPTSAVHIMAEGRLARLKKDIDGSIVSFEKAIKIQDQFKQLQHVCFYDVGWSHIFNLEWGKAKVYFQSLLAESEWSKAFYSYMVALCLLDEGQTERADYLLSTIPSLVNRTYGGRTITVEQFVLKKVQLYTQNGRCDLFLPQLEISYLWNGYSQMQPEKIKQTLVVIDTNLARVKSGSQDANPTQEALCLLLKGAALKNLGNFGEALECFDLVESMESLIKEETWIVPHAVYEAGSMLILQGNDEDGQKRILKARDKYTNYIFELRLHLRIHLQQTH
eukprot:TRINITY_DN3727_c0_g1_i1.p1 TRINITY_DN3727_c0_g1~~TRINITY_DN3727_c0_g1_i1.p1  ORF type:complete len:607 (+),score=155.24 TRINITY_DN3727_c0_g1_i1:48-1868(+)